MTVPLLAAALLAALTVGLGVPPGGRPHARARPGTRAGPGPSRRGESPTGRATAPLMVRAVSALAGAAAWLLLGGLLGGAVGVIVALALPVLISRLEPARARRERLDLIRSAPLVADLLAAALMAGVPLEHAVPVVARAIGGPAGVCLAGVHRRTELGEPMARAWAGLSQTPGLGGVARAVARSSRTGAPLASLLAQSAEDLRAAACAAALVEVRATAVRAVLPLGLCLLPAFALLGIAPIVGGLLPSI